MTSTVLVTGGAGYVGSHIVAALASTDRVPIVLDDFSNSDRGVIARLSAMAPAPIECVEADVRNVDTLRNTFRRYPIAAVIHCAGLKAVDEGESRPLAYYDVNVGGAIALAEVMGEAGVGTLVYASSATVYGQADVMPVGESAPLRPQGVYARTKRDVEEFLRDLSRANPNWRIGILRHFNPAGAHPSASIGEAPRGKPANLVPLLCRIAAGELSELVIFGSDWPTPDGTGVRDYIHVDDLALGHVAALDHLAHREGATVLNLGAGIGYSVLDVVAAFEKACGRTIARRYAPRRQGDVGCSYADVSRAEQLLGWHATRDLDAICADAWRWQRERGPFH